MTSPLYAQISEKAFQEHIRKQALYRGWLFYHPWSSKHSPEGFPDCVMVRGTRVIYAELKAAKGKVTAAQEKWLTSLVAARQEVYLWRPADIEQIERILK